MVINIPHKKIRVGCIYCDADPVGVGVSTNVSMCHSYMHNISCTDYWILTKICMDTTHGHAKALIMTL